MNRHQLWQSRNEKLRFGVVVVDDDDDVVFFFSKYDILTPEFPTQESSELLVWIFIHNYWSQTPWQFDVLSGMRIALRISRRSDMFKSYWYWDMRNFMSVKNIVRLYFLITCMLKPNLWWQLKCLTLANASSHKKGTMTNNSCISPNSFSNWNIPLLTPLSQTCHSEMYLFECLS